MYSLNTHIMKRSFYFLLWTQTLLLPICLNSCKADINLNDIDPKAELNLNMAVPIGSMSITISDLLETNNIEHLYIDSLDNKGVFVYKDTLRKRTSYHKIDLSQYISKTSLIMNVYDKLKNEPIMHDHKITGNSSSTIQLDFPLALKLNGINSDLANERLDSAQIKNASFVSTISSYNLPIKWEWIDKVALELGDNFSRKEGNNIVVYTRGERYGFGEDISIMIDEFSLCLMKEQNPTDYYNNVLDSCSFVIHFYITIPTEAGDIYIPEDAAFRYGLSVQFIDYHAVWGMFAPSKDIYNDNLVCLKDSINSWSIFEKSHLPFADPVMDLSMTTKVAGAMRLTTNYLFIQEEETGQKVYATFSGDTTFVKHLSKNEYLPLNSTIGDSAVTSIRLDKTPERGHIDRLFTIKPDYLGYKILMDFDVEETPQIRIVPSSDVNFDISYSLPFIFNEGLYIHYEDTLVNINLSKFTLDSLYASAQVIDTIKTGDVKLYLKIQNTIPVRIKGVLSCLDESSHEVMDPIDPNQPFRLTNSDTTYIVAPEYTLDSSGSWQIRTPGVVTNIASLKKEQLDALGTIRQIRFEAILDDESLQYAYQQGSFNVRLSEEQKVTVSIGLTTNVDAILDFESTNK